MTKPKAARRYSWEADDPEHFYENQHEAPVGFVETLPEDGPKRRKQKPKGGAHQDRLGFRAGEPESQVVNA